MKRKIVSVDRSYQYDLLGDAPAAGEPQKLTKMTGARRFNEPNGEDIFIGTIRLDKHLKQARLTAPLLVATLLKEQDWQEFESCYAPTGRAPYAPRAMVGLILFGIMQGVSSLRGMERFARQDLGCMWVTGGICPDHASIGRFIVLHEGAMATDFFESLTRTVLKITGSDSAYVAGDGTVIEAACSHYNLLRKEAAKEQLEKARRALDLSPNDRKQQDQVIQAAQAEKIFNDRKQSRIKKGANTDSLAVSPTEPEAMIQPQKRGRGMAPSYKPSVLANNKRVILAHSVDPSQETTVIPEMLDQSKRVTGEETQELSLDAGYFCTSVIATTLEREISLLCPEGKGGAPHRNGKVFVKSQFRYIPEEDVYLCPAGERLYSSSKKNKKYVMYKTKPSVCASCVLREHCTKDKAGRRIRRYESDETKEALREVMQHPQAQRIFRQRQAMVEPVFSALKLTQGLTRFRRRGLSGVKREFALHVLAYNLSRAVQVYIWVKYRRIRPLLRDYALFLTCSLNDEDYGHRFGHQYVAA